MLKALLKKQFQEIFRNKKRYGRKAAKSGVGGKIGTVFLFLYLIGIFGWLFYTVMSKFCQPMFMMGYGWLYFTYAQLLGTLLAVFTTMFMAQSQLFNAKDNDLLLSMPIPPRYILFARMLPLYLENLAFEALVILPSYYVCIRAGFADAKTILFGVIILLILPMFGTVLACLLGWVAAAISSRLKRKNLVSVVLSLAFIGLYYYVYFKAMNNLNEILASSIEIGEKVRSYLFLFYHLGLGAAGEAGSLLIACAIMAALFAVMYLILSKTYIQVVTTKKGAAKIRYRERALKTTSPSGALLRKERIHFFGSSVYLLNTGLGTAFMVVGAAAMIIKQKDLRIMGMAFIEEGVSILPMLVCAAICMMSMLNMVSAPSISLEGKSMWILRSLPVSEKQILQQKLKFHVLVSLPAALVTAVIAGIVLYASPFMFVMLLVLPTIMIFLTGVVGLFWNLKRPRLDWENEAIVVKQSGATVFTMLCMFGIMMLAVVLFVVIGYRIDPALYLLICSAVLALLSLILYKWVVGKGCEKLRELQ